MSNIRKPLLGELLDYGNPFTKGLVGLWLMNEGTGNTVQDLSGNSSLGTFTTEGGAKPNWTSGETGPAINFSGTSKDRIVCTNTVPITGSFTCIAKFKLNAYVNNAALVDASYANQFLFRFSAANQLQCYVAGLNNIMVSTKNDFHTDLTWHTAALVHDEVANTKTVYVDGVFDKTAASNDTPTGVTTYDIGAYADSDEMNGLIEYVYIYNHALSASEIQQLYREPFCMVRTRRRRVIFDEIAGVPPTSSPYYYREIASRRIA